ncbi:alpha/beta fold hydrolase [Streptomyces sp. NPDC008141]|uniref:alpha/beta fold hydrolase n=1 Tax=Streptomyces sp. NPDC008141 TaxID=3364815 RepID=UPI0036E775B9
MVASVTAPGGGELAYEVWGDPKGHPVFLMHGTPGSRLGPRPRTFDLHKLGIRLIAYDRPGYGDSERHEGRSVADAAKDVLAVAEAVGIADRYSVVGRSGGGPHALACAARTPERVASVAAVVSVAPPVEGFDWLAGMAESNVSTYTLIKDHHPDLSQLGKVLARSAEDIRRNPSSLLTSLNEEMPTADRLVVADAEIRRLLLRNYLSAVGEFTDTSEDPPHPTGWIDDLVAFRKPWGFQPQSIQKDVPVLLWHGEHDVFAPLSHFHWLADNIPGATAVLQPSVAHFSALPALLPILAWVRDRAEPDFQR